MDFTNYTPFPALAFAGVDQFEQEFHVIAARQTLTWNDAGQLEYADEQLDLCEEDEFFGAMNQSSVRQESDYCHFKPKCDVIVNATAYAPQGTASPRFKVKLTVRGPDQPAPLPERPQGLNPLMSPSSEALDAWKAATEAARQNPLPGPILLEKELIVTGERELRRRIWPLPSLCGLTRLCTLGLLRPNPWTLTSARPCTTLPLRYEQAWGGQCRIEATDKRARKIPKKYRLTPEQRQQHPDGEQAPIAHEICQENLFGKGFVTQWYLDATGLKRLPAPQIESADRPFTAAAFWKTLRGKQKPPLEPVGLGIRFKGHPDRLRLTGTIDDAFIRSGDPLPQDFDFAIWNAAPPDQQTDYLKGDETIELVNLCRPGAPGSRTDAQGDTYLSLTLPRHECYAFVRLHSGEVFRHPLRIDTVIVEPDERRLSLVWRAILVKDEELPVRAADLGMETFEDRDALERKVDQLMRVFPIDKLELTDE